MTASITRHLFLQSSSKITFVILITNIHLVHYTSPRLHTPLLKDSYDTNLISITKRSRSSHTHIPMSKQDCCWNVAPTSDGARNF